MFPGSRRALCKLVPVVVFAVVAGRSFSATRIIAAAPVPKSVLGRQINDFSLRDFRGKTIATMWSIRDSR